MYFKNPNILFALFALIIPILVHLFNLRRCQKTNFTNVKFLKKLTSETRKSSKLKKALLLCVRIITLSLIIIAFAQPILKKPNYNPLNETVIYLDNSISNKEKETEGEILKVNIQNLINNYPKNLNINIITNDKVFKDQKINDIKNELINLKYSNTQLSYKIITLKANSLFKHDSSQKNIIYISDFQKNNTLKPDLFDPKINNILFQNIPISKSNISIDSVFFSEKNKQSILNVIVKNQYNSKKNIPISVYNNESLISKTSVNVSKKINKVDFSLPLKKELNLKIKINDENGINDNIFYATKKKDKKLNILTIGKPENNVFLSKIFTDDEFSFSQQNSSNINYGEFHNKDLIIINEVEKLSTSLTENLKKFNKKGNNIIFIPNNNIEKNSNNRLINNMFNDEFEKTRLTKINFSHPIFKNVFEKKITNFDFPIFKKHYKLKNYESKILSFENENPFLVFSNNKYIFSASINNQNTNFKQSPLIVLTFYKIAKSLLTNNTPYYIIGTENEITFEAKLSKDEIVTLSNNSEKFIPLQKIKLNSVSISTKNKPSTPGIYSVQNKNFKENIAYNYSKSESTREYYNLNSLKNKHITTKTSIKDSLADINYTSEIGALWKWFIIFALLFLVVELLILKYYK